MTDSAENVHTPNQDLISLDENLEGLTTLDAEAMQGIEDLLEALKESQIFQNQDSLVNALQKFHVSTNNAEGIQTDDPDEAEHALLTNFLEAKKNLKEVLESLSVEESDLDTAALGRQLGKLEKEKTELVESQEGVGGTITAADRAVTIEGSQPDGIKEVQDLMEESRQKAADANNKITKLLSANEESTKKVNGQIVAAESFGQAVALLESILQKVVNLRIDKVGLAQRVETLVSTTAVATESVIVEPVADEPEVEQEPELEPEPEDEPPMAQPKFANERPALKASEMQFGIQADELITISDKDERLVSAEFSLSEGGIDFFRSTQEEVGNGAENLVVARDGENLVLAVDENNHLTQKVLVTNPDQETMQNLLGKFGVKWHEKGFMAKGGFKLIKGKTPEITVLDGNQVTFLLSPSNDKSSNEEVKFLIERTGLTRNAILGAGGENGELSLDLVMGKWVLAQQASKAA